MRKIIGLASLGLLMPAAASSAELSDIKAGGFVDIVWTIADGTDVGKNGAEGRFDTSGEIDLETNIVSNVTTRLDADINPAGSGDSARLEQAFIKWDINQQFDLKGGVFNNRLGWEKEDAPDLYQITHGQLYDIWDSQTSLTGNNLAGVEFGVNVDIVTLYAGFLNDLGDVPEENSFKIAAEIRPMQDLNVTAGFITQDVNAENIFDVHATWVWNKLTLGGEILTADEIFDLGMQVTANYVFTNEFSGTGRFDYVDYAVSGTDSTSSITVAGLYTIAKNLFANAEIRINSDDNEPVTAPVIGEGDGTTVRAELIATF
jgi:hypothetical protein